MISLSWCCWSESSLGAQIILLAIIMAYRVSRDSVSNWSSGGLFDTRGKKYKRLFQGNVETCTFLLVCLRFPCLICCCRLVYSDSTVLVQILSYVSFLLQYFIWKGFLHHVDILYDGRCLIILFRTDGQWQSKTSWMKKSYANFWR